MLDWLKNFKRSLQPHQKIKLGMSTIAAGMAPLFSGWGGSYVGFFAEKAAATEYATAHGCGDVWDAWHVLEYEALKDVCGTACEEVCKTAYEMMNSQSGYYAIWFGIGGFCISAVALAIYIKKINADNLFEAEQGHLPTAGSQSYGSISQSTSKV